MATLPVTCHLALVTKMASGWEPCLHSEGRYDFERTCIFKSSRKIEMETSCELPKSRVPHVEVSEEAKAAQEVQDLHQAAFNLQKELEYYRDKSRCKALSRAFLWECSRCRA